MSDLASLPRRAAARNNGGRLYIIGPSGSGKSAVAKLLSDSYIDLDVLVARNAGMSVDDIFATQGEEAFRRMEHEALVNAEGNVIATGGGCCAVPDNLRYMKEHGRIVCLIASPAELLRRISQSYSRPLVDGEAALRKMLGLRAYAYFAADYLLDTTGLAAEEVAEKVRYWMA